MFVHRLTSRNLSNVNSMHSQSTTVNYSILFNNIDHAILFAENEHNNKIKWERQSRNIISSGDLIYVMYTIETMRVYDDWKNINLD